MRVLLVDDDRSILRAMGRFFQRDGIDSVQACTLAEAEDALTAGPFDAVLSDLSLGDANGLRVLAEARGRDANMALFLVTGAGEPPSTVGPDVHFVAKPCDVPSLVERVRQVCRARRPSTAIP